MGPRNVITNQQLGFGNPFLICSLSFLISFQPNPNRPQHRYQLLMIFWLISTCFSLQILQFFGPKFWPCQSLVGKTSEVCFSMHFANRNQNLKESWLEIHYLLRYQISGLWLSTTVARFVKWKEGVGTVTTFRISGPNWAIGGSRHSTIASVKGVSQEKGVKSWLTCINDFCGTMGILGWCKEW